MTEIRGFCLLCRKKTVMTLSNGLINVVLPITQALGYKANCTRCNTIVFKIK